MGKLRVACQREWVGRADNSRLQGPRGGTSAVVGGAAVVCCDCCLAISSFVSLPGVGAGQASGGGAAGEPEQIG